MKWFENSELKNKEESADIIRAICNVSFNVVTNFNQEETNV